MGLSCLACMGRSKPHLVDLKRGEVPAAVPAATTKLPHSGSAQLTLAALPSVHLTRPPAADQRRRRPGRRQQQAGAVLQVQGGGCTANTVQDGHLLQRPSSSARSPSLAHAGGWHTLVVGTRLSARRELPAPCRAGLLLRVCPHLQRNRAVEGAGQGGRWPEEPGGGGSGAGDGAQGGRQLRCCAARQPQPAPQVG